MNAYAQQDQSGGYGSDPSGNYAGGYGAANAFPVDPSQQPAGANPYAQNPSRQQHPGSEYGGPQKLPTNQLQHGDEYDPSDNQAFADEHEHDPNPGKQDTANSPLGTKPTKAGHKKITPVKKGPASSAYPQDPYHHELMRLHAKAAKHGVTTEHLKSFVHVASLALAMLSHQLGMTEGHEEQEEEEAEEEEGRKK